MNTTKIEEIRQTLNEYMSKHGNTISQWKNNDYDYAQTLPVDEQEEIVPELITKIESLTKEAVSEALQELKDELPEIKPNALKPGGLVISEDGKTVETRYLTQASSGGYNQALSEVTNIIDNKIKKGVDNGSSNTD